MSYQPIIIMEGYASWAFLKRTLPKQMAHFETSSALQKDEAYFLQKMPKVNSAEELVSDRRLLRITLTAFGLEADIDAKAFIKKVLSDGLSDASALANRLADKRYAGLSQAFGLGKGQTPNTKREGFAEQIFNQYTKRSFEARVGEQSQPLRIALNAERELAALATSNISDDTKWFTIMGSKPLRTLFETALGLPASIGQIDIDQQLSTFKSKAKSTFGSASISQFSDPDKFEKLIQNYLIREQVKSGNAALSPAQAAIQLLAR